MTIDRMIERLTEVRATYGNMDVVIQDHYIEERVDGTEESWDGPVEEIQVGLEQCEYSLGARVAKVIA